jgi:hypothetical protein
MAMCTRTTNLEVHHVRRDGDNDIGNARVLCKPCHAATPSYGTPGKSPTEFDQATKDRAIRRAGNQCECTSSTGCHL